MAAKAHLFLCIENGSYAVSNDSDGGNLPREDCRSGWRFVRSFDLGAEEPLPFSANSEPIERALSSDGYWLAGDDGEAHRGP